MKPSPRLAPLLALLAVALAGCGGHHRATVASQPVYHTRYGVQAHSPTFGLPPKSTPLPPRLSGVPTVEMLDTITLSTIPGQPRVLAGYTAGHWPTYLPLVRAYPHAHVVSIAISWAFHAMCLDVEPGDAVPSQAGPWVLAVLHDRSIRFIGGRPCVYGSLSEMPAIERSVAATLGAGWRARVFLWDANWTFFPHLDSGFDATQWTDHALNRNLDESTVTLAFAGLVPKPPPPRPVCFGAHAQNTATCRHVRSQVASWQRAAASSERAYVARKCPALNQRARWFGTHVDRPPRSKRASRERAYAASVRAYVRNGCKVFAGRVGIFNALAAEAHRRYR